MAHAGGPIGFRDTLSIQWRVIFVQENVKKEKEKKRPLNKNNWFRKDVHGHGIMHVKHDSRINSQIPLNCSCKMPPTNLAWIQDLSAI